MALVLRHLLAILLLPFVVVALVPAWLRASEADGGWEGASLLAWLGRSTGAVAFVGGLALFAWCVGLFARVGRGTLAPWDPTQSLVAVGPYRYVGNPMISGVALMLAGQALFFGSWLTAAWAAAFVLVNHVYFVVSEEPGMERRFGEGYRTYRTRVPRWLPRWRTEDGSEDEAGDMLKG
jgi:protein-S-isoprenylcysteine O-methyltransferase Ste14